MQNYDKVTKLNGQAIDEISEALSAFLAEIETERATSLRIRLSMEEALLRFKDHFGPEQEIHVFIGSQLRRNQMQIELTGEAYNPLTLKENDIDNWSSSLLSPIGISPNYYYSGGKNNLRLSLPRKEVNPVYKLLFCVILGTLLGTLGRNFLPEAIRVNMIDSILQPLFSLWQRTLTLLSGPLIFILVLTTVLNTGRVDVQGGSSKRILSRYVFLSILSGLFAMFTINLFLKLPYVETSLDAGFVSTLLNVLFGVVPEDMINPFIAVNTAQLVLMAVMIGKAISLLQGEGDVLVRFVKQCYDIGLTLADMVGRLVPFFTVTLLTLAIWNGQTAIFTYSWIAMLVFLALALLYGGIALLRTSAALKVPLKVLIHKLKASFLVTLRTGSLNEAYTYIETCVIKRLGVEKNFAKALLPSGLVLYMPVSTAELIVFSVYAAWIHHMHADIGWYFLLLFHAVVLSMASPPVAGVSLISFMTIFSNLNIPSEALVGGMIADIVLGIAASAFNQMILQMELLTEADRIGLVRKKTLMKDVGGKTNG